MTAVEPGTRLTNTEAIVAAIGQAMRVDPSIVLIGQDIGPFGGAMQGAKGLYEEFGAGRVLEAPISESAMVGAGIGAAMFGRRPIVEISFGEFLPAAMNQLVNQAPNIHYMSGGVLRLPLVIRTRVGDGPYGGHPQDYSAWFAHIPGMKVVVPASPIDAKGLMTSAIRDDGPVLFVEPMSLAHSSRDLVPDGEVTVAIGEAHVIRRGGDVTVVASGSTVPMAVHAATELEGRGVDVEVIDLRSLRPWDRSTVSTSVMKTTRLVCVQESWPTAGFSAEVLAAAAEDLGGRLCHAARVGTLEVPVPSGALRRFVLPSAARLVAAIEAASRRR